MISGELLNEAYSALEAKRDGLIRPFPFGASEDQIAAFVELLNREGFYC